MSTISLLDRIERDGFPPLRTEADLRALEHVPWAERIAARSTYEALCNAAALDPQRPAIQFLRTGEPDEAPLSLSYAEFLGRVRQTANLLHTLGVGPRDVVSFLLPLLPQSYAVLFGAEAAGIANPVNPLLEPGQLASILNAAGTKVLVALGPTPGVEIWQKVQALRGDVPGLRAIVQVGGDAPAEQRDGVLGYEAALARQPADRLLSGRQSALDDVAAYMHTGGTTGLPKLVQHTHANQLYQAWVCGALYGLNEPRPTLCGLPLFHVSGSLNQGLVVFAWGGTAVICTPGGFRTPAVVRNYWRLAEHYRPRFVSAVPTVLSGLLLAPSDGLDLSGVAAAAAGGSAIPVEVGRALQDKIGKPVLEVYGMTETASILTSAPLGGDVPLGSVGYAAPYSRVKTVCLDAKGRYERDCAVDEIGVVVMKGPGVFPSYVQERHNRTAFVTDGWLNSGDLGRLDAAGRLWITGRAKDLIIRSGHNIDPIVIEEALYQHPAVSLAAAVGKPDAYAGELPVAYVQLKPDAAATPEELTAFVRERISERAAAPREVFVVDPLPLTGVGKVFKPALRWDAAQRVFGELLAPLAPLAPDGVRLAVAVAAHPTHGTLATVSLTGADTADRPALEHAVHEALAPFTIHHEVRWEA
ncbi:MAG TPA: acyl-CoA synthetase [bacterium]|nr:acyl-CoA synthetase [bacterium]